jgi:hypothetical protein
MSFRSVPVAFICLFTTSVFAQEEEHTLVVERGPHHAVVERISPYINELGEFAAVTNQFVQLENGLNYWDTEKKAWLEAREEIELVPGGAVARYLQQQAVFSRDANDPKGALSLIVQGHYELRSSILALRYVDAATGKDAIVAMAKNGVGELLVPNQVVYRDVLDGVSADLLFTVRRGSIESDLVLRETPPDPTDFGLNPETVLVEVITEFMDAPEPSKKETVLASVEEPEVRAKVAQPDWIDEDLDFGFNQFIQGRAFAWSAAEAARRQPSEFAPVGKRWTKTTDGRTVLIESVEYVRLFDELLALPSSPDRRKVLEDRARAWALRTPADIRKAGLMAVAAEGQRLGASTSSLRLPPRQMASLDSGAPTGIQLARRESSNPPGLVIDWTSVVSTNKMRFKGDTTYYVSGPVTVGTATNTVVFEGGTVIKYAPTNNAALTVAGPVAWEGTAYRPVVLTARDDQSIGESITNSTPSGYYAQTALYIDANTSGADAFIQHLRVAHARTGIQLFKRTGHAIHHAQFVNCENGIRPDNAVFSVRNALFHNVLTNLNQVTASTGRCEHITVNTATRFNNNLTALTLTNSILAAVTTAGSYTANSVSTYASISGVFQGLGSGSNYLASGSAERNAGTTNIQSDLLRELRQMTTFPPVLLSNNFTNSTLLTPQAGRDTDTPDRGYHYAPLDYCWNALQLTNSTLTLSNGVAIGIYGVSGLSARNGGKLVSAGRPDALNRLTRYSTVQEQPVAWGTTSGTMYWMTYNATSPNPEVRLLFTDISLPAGPRVFIDNIARGAAGVTAFSHSQLRGVLLDVTATLSGTTVSFTNNLFDRCTVNWTVPAGPSYLPFELNLYNNLFFVGAVTFANNNTTYSYSWTAKDNLFDSDTLQQSGVNAPTASNNGYRSGLSSLGGAGNKTGLVPDYVSGPATNWVGVRGSFYYPTSGASTSLTNLVDTGSRTAANASLYHFTTRAATGTSETSSQVDIGYHYIGVDANGAPLDTDGDGIPNYREDRDGDGVVDSGETSWTSATDAGLQIRILQPRTPAP